MNAPMRRGVAALAVTGGALSLAGAAGDPPAPVAALAEAPTTAARSTGAAAGPADGPPVADAVALVRMAGAADVARSASARVAAIREQAEREQAERERAEAAERQRRGGASRGSGDSAPRAGTAVPVGGDCGLSTSGLGAVKPWVRAAGEILGCRFGRPQMYGVAARSGASDHPAGLAIDFMVDRATGDALAGCALANRDALGISYVIFRQRIDTGSGWKAMEDRGSATANHMDHVHISFRSGGARGGPVTC